MKLFIANKNYSSWSLRPWVLMRELDIPFEEELTPFDPATNALVFGRFSPTAKVPCLHDGDIKVWESIAIVEYLAEREPRVWPAAKAARAWARSAAAEMHAGFANIRNDCSMNCALRVRLYSLSKALLAEWARVDRLWCEGLDSFGGPFLAGQTFSAVDAFFAPLAFRAQTYQPPLSQKAEAYVQHLLALPSMRQWYEAALIEPWRDQMHENETLEVGECLEDFRKSDEASR